MASYNLNQVKVGLKIMADGDPCVIVGTDVVKPGKGQAFTKVKYKNYKTGRVNERTLKASDSFEGADVIEREMQYLYSDGRAWTFMDQDTYEQVEADPTTVGEDKQWLKEEDLCLVTLLEGNPTYSPRQRQCQPRMRKQLTTRLSRRSRNCVMPMPRKISSRFWISTQTAILRIMPNTGWVSPITSRATTTSR